MNFKRAIFVGGMKLKKAAPHIMMAVGIGGIIYAFVDGCIKSRKLDETIEEEVNAVEEANEIYEEACEEYDENPTEECKAKIKTYKKNVRKAKAALYKKIARHYLKTIIVGSLSIVLIGGSHIVLTERLVMATTTLVALENDFRDYRNAVREKYGEEAEKEIMYGRQMEEREVKVIDDATGEERTEIRKVAKWRQGHSIYAMAFCKSQCQGMFADNTYYDMQTIENMKRIIEKDYEKKSWAFLQKAYDYMHHPITREIIGVGWMKGLANDDGYIKIEVIPTVFEFTPGELENGYIIDFNVVGKIENYFNSVSTEAERSLMDND